MKKFSGVFGLLLCSAAVLGQTANLSGTILDKADDAPIVAGSVSLLNAKNGAQVAAVVSNATGAFTLRNVAKGSYTLRITYLGYDTLSQAVNLTADRNLGKLYLNEDDKMLSEVVVQGKRPDMIVKGDTIEFDAAGYKVAENAVVEDLLKKLPGVEIDKDGKITVNGKEVKKFRVDNKDFFSDDPKVASKNLPAEMVEKLQVVDQRSEMARLTGFDDGEEETIINLTIRPGMKKGTMGNVLLGGGHDRAEPDDFRYQGGAFVNHMQNSDRATLILGANNNNNMGAADLGANQFGGMRMRRGGGGIVESQNASFNINKEFSKKLNINADVRFNNSDNNSHSSVEQSTIAQTQSQLDKTTTTNLYQSKNVSANMNIEWKPDTLNELKFRPNFRYNTSNSHEVELSNRFYLGTVLDSIFSSDNNSWNVGSGFSFGGQLDYAHRFANKRGRVLSFSLSGNYNSNNSQEKSLWNRQDYYDNIRTTMEERDQRDENDNLSDNYRISASYVEPIGRSNFIQLSYRISQAETEDINSTYYIDALNAADLIDSLSRSTRRLSTNQRLGLSFKAVREKYNWTLGFNVDPTNSENRTYQPSPGQFSSFPIAADFAGRLPNMIGDSLLPPIIQDVINFSPTVNFRYNFAQRTTLEFRYEGETNQPSATQLRNYVDKSRPTNWTKGNPNLKPGYTNDIRLQFNKYVPETQLAYRISLNGGFSLNDITSVTEMLDGGVRQTTYENINGNWNTNMRGMFNTPFRNKKFSVSDFFNASMRETNSFVTLNGVAAKNRMTNLSLSNNASFNYRSELFDMGINASIRYNDISYSASPTSNQETYDFGGGYSTTWYLPYKWTFSTDISFTNRRGYAEGYNISETMWNAYVMKQIFNKSIGTGSLKLQIYDILQDRNSVSAAATTNGFRTTETTVIPSYFMCSFIYKFTMFPTSGAAKASDFENGERGGRGGRGGEGGPPPGGGSGGRPMF
ncbi:TonB-dependent receptor [Candidatus Symbiothrix dinenymphae]|nr:TonB-dependent receptor [Candidatus Symbiothrix dinenymphae]